MMGPHLVEALRSLWTGDDATHRRRTLARLAVHQRQLEAWWKCELGAHLWDHVNRFGERSDVWLESVDRADITIATGIESARGLQIDPDGAVCIPIELKTCGTWWGASRSSIAKALDERGKKKLSQDMHDLRQRGRPNKPFGAVGLLLTHVGHASDPVFLAYLEYARDLGRHHELDVLLDEGIELPDQGGSPVTARQIFWVSPGTPVDRSATGSPSRVQDAITQHQRAWMTANGYSASACGWMNVLEENLFEPLDPDAREELEAGDGNELSGKLTAPWSSSALVLNVFHFWRKRDRTILARALRRSNIASIRFEACHATGNRHARANLDVELCSDGEPVLAIESKLAEPFGHHAPLVSSYLEKPELWRELPRCFELAKAWARQPALFQRLDVAQLLKHILGLTKSYQRSFELLYLWYDPSRLLGEHERGPVTQHALELDRFASEVGAEVGFRHASYQALFAELQDADAKYVSYLRSRYFD